MQKTIEINHTEFLGDVITKQWNEGWEVISAIKNTERKDTNWVIVFKKKGPDLKDEKKKLENAVIALET